jgi:hypothetical protein
MSLPITSYKKRSNDARYKRESSVWGAMRAIGSSKNNAGKWSMFPWAGAVTVR